MKVFVIPVAGPCYEADLPETDGSCLEALHDLVGGYIEGLPIPHFVSGHENGTAYINEDGKGQGLEVNYRATDFMVPGIGIFYGDYIAGTMVLAGVDYSTGENADVPEGMVRRAKLIESEAG